MLDLKTTLATRVPPKAAHIVEPGLHASYFGFTLLETHSFLLQASAGTLLLFTVIHVVAVLWGPVHRPEPKPRSNGTSWEL